MKDAIKSVKDAMNGVYPLLIGDRPVRTEREIISRNPAQPDDIVGRVSSASKDECDAAIEEALKVREQWRRTTPEKRASYLFKAAEEMRRQRFELAALEVIEVGKTWRDADGDVAKQSTTLNTTAGKCSGSAGRRFSETIRARRTNTAMFRKESAWSLLPGIFLSRLRRA
jgi:acyl-CoA reductase-like NAD-dependent aldehyde dehydrogenase